MLGAKTKNAIGIQVTNDALVAVFIESAVGMPPLLRNYAKVDWHEGGLLSSAPALARALRVVCRAFGNPRTPLALSLPTEYGTVALVEFPVLSGDELRSAITTEASKYIPLPMDEVSLSFEVLHRSESDTRKSQKNDTVEVALVAAEKSAIQLVETAIRDASLDLDLLELEIFSLMRTIPTVEHGTVCVVNIQPHGIHIALVLERQVRLIRTLQLDTVTLTTAADATALISPVRATLDELLALYLARHSQAAIRQFLIVGAKAHTQALYEALCAASPIQKKPTALLNPWQEVQLPPQAKANLTDARKGELATALGLALAQFTVQE
jgi:Tfp pilus assembly PilM family ATPase